VNPVPVRLAILQMLRGDRVKTIDIRYRKHGIIHPEDMSQFTYSSFSEDPVVPENGTSYMEGPLVSGNNGLYHLSHVLLEYSPSQKKQGFQKSGSRTPNFTFGETSFIWLRHLA
jgi:hypothetical protein